MMTRIRRRRPPGRRSVARYRQIRPRAAPGQPLRTPRRPAAGFAHRPASRSAAAAGFAERSTSRSTAGFGDGAASRSCAALKNHHRLFFSAAAAFGERSASRSTAARAHRAAPATPGTPAHRPIALVVRVHLGEQVHLVRARDLRNLFDPLRRLGRHAREHGPFLLLPLRLPARERARGRARPARAALQRDEILISVRQRVLDPVDREHRVDRAFEELSRVPFLLEVLLDVIQVYTWRHRRIPRQVRVAVAGRRRVSEPRVRRERALRRHPLLLVHREEFLDEVLRVGAHVFPHRRLRKVEVTRAYQLVHRVLVLVRERGVPGQ